MPVSENRLHLSFDSKLSSSLADISSVVAQAMATYKTIANKQEQVSQLDNIEQETKPHSESFKQSYIQEKPSQ